MASTNALISSAQMLTGRTLPIGHATSEASWVVMSIHYMHSYTVSSDLHFISDNEIAVDDACPRVVGPAIFVHGCSRIRTVVKR